MTMFANRVGDTDNIKVNITYGPVTASVEEQRGHLRHFHGDLGRLLDAMEAEAAARADIPGE